MVIFHSFFVCLPEGTNWFHETWRGLSSQGKRLGDRNAETINAMEVLSQEVFF